MIINIVYNPLMPIILKNLTLAYHQHNLFQNICLTLPENSCTCLLGPSGVGKSNLLHAMAGAPMDAQTQLSGTIKTSDGKPLTNHVMLMTQQEGLLPWLEVIDNVCIGYRLRGTLTAEVILRAKDFLNRVEIQEKDWHKKPKALSGGMRQRVALVRMMMEDKPVWLMDEPFSAVDAITRYKLQNLVVKLWQGKTVLLVTHDPLEALRLGHHVYVMSGTPAKICALSLPSVALPREIDAELFVYQKHILTLLNKEGS